MRNIENKILLPFLIILIFSIASVGTISYYGSCKIFESLAIIQPLKENFKVNPAYVSSQLLEFQKYTIFVAIIAIIAASQLTIFFVYNFVNPIKKLAAACDEVSKGNFKIDISYKGKDEIGILESAFLRMISKLNEYISQLLEVTKLNEKIINGVNYGIIVFNTKNEKLLINQLASLYIKEEQDLHYQIEEIIENFLKGSIPSFGTLKIENKNHITRYIEYNISYFEEIFILSLLDVTEKEILKQKIEHINRLTFIGEMSAAIAHEIRNPLQGIKSCFQVLESNSKIWNDTSKMLITLIYQELERINKIISELLNYARSPEPKPQSISLKQTITESLPFLSHHLKKKQLSLNINIPQEADLIFVDESHFKQIIINILTNAIRASKVGGQIDITAESSVREIIVYIKDYGIGISKENLEKIFIPFFSTFDEGTGLGLSVVHTLVLKNNGQIRIESKENIGTTVYLIFPRSFSHKTSEN